MDLEGAACMQYPPTPEDGTRSTGIGVMLCPAWELNKGSAETPSALNRGTIPSTPKDAFIIQGMENNRESRLVGNSYNPSPWAAEAENCQV